IPLMKRVGFPGTKAGAVEVAASTNGQLTPPIMGAAAFLMVEYVGISYVEVIKAALLPALISYIALIYIVHLEACKAGMTGLPRRHNPTLVQSLLSFTGTILGLCVISALVYYGVGWTKDVFGDAATPIVTVALLIAYVGLVKVSANHVQDGAIEIDAELTEVPDPG
ncbi:TRAP transporter large permease subunit, partial [Vibrio parahaemolyticus]|nr:TRAP transporter large permease subunit [Vibrio parahaemolyticus]